MPLQCGIIGLHDVDIFEQGAKDAGKMRDQGNEYVVTDGDLMNFLCSA